MSVARSYLGYAPDSTGRAYAVAVFNHTNLIYIFGGRINTTSGTETATVRRYAVNANRLDPDGPDANAACVRRTGGRH